MRNMKNLILNELRKRWTVSEKDTGKYRILRKSGMKFVISSYRVEGFGSLSVIDMTAMLGLMKMESLILTAEEKDLPLFSADSIQAMGKQTLLVEFYDTMIAPLDPQAVEIYSAVKSKYAGIPERKAEPRWYDGIRYDFSLGAADKSLKELKYTIANDYLAAYLKNAELAPGCDPAVKKAKTREYVDGLFRNGGPAVDQFKKLFGESDAREIFGKCVFSCDA